MPCGEDVGRDVFSEEEVNLVEETIDIIVWNDRRYIINMYRYDCSRTEVFSDGNEGDRYTSGYPNGVLCTIAIT